MIKNENHNPVRTIVYGFPVLFSQWLAVHLSQNPEIEIREVFPIRDFENENFISNTDVILFRIHSTSEENIIRRIKTFNVHVLAWWAGDSLSDEQMVQLVKAGANGILGDHHLLDDVEQAILNVGKQGLHINDLLGNGLFHFCKKQQNVQFFGDNNIPAFTSREQQVIELRKQGNTSKEIGAQLCLSKKSIDKVFYDLYRRYDCSNFFEILKIYENEKNNSTVHVLKR